jgi:AcrR family transcriptional regulator
MASDSKNRMIRSAYALFRERGYSGTGFREINAHSGVARGAIYHHFPGGKNELAQDVIRLAGNEVGGALEAFAQRADAVSTLEAFVTGWIHHVREHDFNAGCSIAAIVAESQHGAPQLADAAAEAFGSWCAILAASLRRGGASPARARRVATLAVAGVEGAVMLCRAERSTRPLEEVGRELRATFEDAISLRSTPS